MKKAVYIVFGLAVMMGFVGCADTSVITATRSVGPETTSMLYIDSTRYRGVYISYFDKASVFWPDWSSTAFYKGVIIPSGHHTLTLNSSMYDQHLTVSYDFEPRHFYFISYDFENIEFLLEDYTERYITESGVTWDGAVDLKQKMEKIIARAGRKTPATVTASQPAAQSPLSNRDTGRLQSALQKSAQTVMGSLDRQKIIAIVNVTSSSQDIAQFVVGELEVILVSNKFPVADRSTLDTIRQEQQLQLSGEVDDDTAVSIGKFVGAKVIIVGDISGSSAMRRLRLRALNTETAQVISSTSEAF
ncbi:MAG: penicillin-binding protein activator LpoB [Treponema sp.]|jgi:hypothetical protein|nr:penicillin-binding protein activator LpoB [Treponema sp.]